MYFLQLHRGLSLCVSSHSSLRRTVSNLPEKPTGTGNDITTLAYCSRIVKTPRLSPWRHPTNQERCHEVQEDLQPSVDLGPESKVLKWSEKTEGKEDQTLRELIPPMEDIRTRTYQRLGSLEDTIRELELSLLDFGPQAGTGHQSETLLNQSGCPAVTPERKSSNRSLERGGEVLRPPVPPKPSKVDTAQVSSVHVCFLQTPLRLPSDSLQTCLRPPSDLLKTSFRPPSDLLQTPFRLHSDSLQTFLRPL